MTNILPLISIIVPVYNVETLLPGCLNSIISQTYLNIEIILVDDGSTDSSGKICDEYAINDKRIIVVHQNNAGVSDARYRGVAIATGEWAYFVDGDDCIPNNSLQILYSYTDDYDLVSGSCMMYDIEKKKVVSQKADSSINSFSGTKFVNDLLLEKRGGALWRQLIKMELLKKEIYLLPKEIKISEDWLLNIKIGLSINKYIEIPEVVYQYNLRPTSVIHSLSLKSSDFSLIDYYISKFIKDNSCFSYSHFCCRLRFFMNCITEKGITDIDFVRCIRETSFLYKKSNVDNFKVLLTYIDNIYIRCFLNKIFNITKLIYHYIIN